MVTIIVVVAGVVAASFACWRPVTVDDMARATQPTRHVVRSFTVIVPARNEAANLPALLRSIDASDARPDEVIVVDDGSTDETAVVARASGARVVAAGALPEGWAGKPWACAVGTDASRADMLVFLDADVSLAPHALGAITSACGSSGGLLSVQPHHRTGRRYEELSALFNAAAVLGSGEFRRHRSAARADRAAAFGPCLVTGRIDLDSVGGFGVVRDSVIEDLDLATEYRRHDLPVTCLLGGRAMSFRMYPDGFRSLVDGWTKNIALGARHADFAAVIATVMWIASLAAAATAAINGTVGWLAGNGDPPAVLLVAYALAAIHLGWQLRRLGTFRWTTSALFPVPLAMFVVVFARSGWRVVRRAPVEWKGRPVPTVVANGRER